MLSAVLSLGLTVHFLLLFRHVCIPAEYLFILLHLYILCVCLYVDDKLFFYRPVHLDNIKIPFTNKCTFY